MGLTPVTTSEAAAPVPSLRPAPPARGFSAWIASLPPRDRLVYAMMLGLLGLIVAVYIFAGLQSLGGMPQIAGAPTETAAAPTAQPTAAGGSAGPSPTAAAPTPTAEPPTPTQLPTSSPTTAPTEQPTREPVILLPTSVVTDTPLPATAQPTTAAATAQPTTAAATAQPTTAAATVQPTTVPATSQPTVKPTVKPTSKPAVKPTAKPTAVPQPPQPTAVPQPAEPTAVPPPTPVVAEQPPALSSQFVWLYFGDGSGTLYVPVQRRVTVENQQVARAAVLGLIEGPRTGLVPLVRQDAQLLGIRIDGGTAVVNFDRDPSGGDQRGYDALVLTLTHFSSVSRVQIQAGGRNIGGPRARPVVNPINPLGLPTDPRQTEFLPLYFVSADGYHHVRVIRMVPKTRQTAEGTVRALLEGPGAYGYALQRVIPEGTDLRGISIANGVVSVDFTRPFADAGDRGTAVQTLTESLTTLPGVRGVRILVEGTSVGDWWGDDYGRVFERPLINGE